MPSLLSFDGGIFGWRESVSNYEWYCFVGTHSICSKNENYLARFIYFFEKQVGMGLNAERMLTEVVRDNA